MSFLDDVLTKKKAEYEELSNKLLKITKGAQEHSLNDGQVEIKVKHVDYNEMIERHAMLENEIAEADGCFSPIVVIY